MMIQSCKFDPILIDSRCFRKGILLQLTNQKQETATVEISPLPGYSEETLDQALQQLGMLQKRLLTKWWTKPALHYLNTLHLHPSVHFGVESALLDLLDPVRTDTTCQRYALLFGSFDEILLRAETVYAEGFREAKIKLGHFTPEAAKKLVDALSDKFALRLDLNRKWKTEQSLAFCSHYPQDHFVYIEEPSSTPKDLVDFPYPYALDETLRDHKNLQPFLQTEHLKAFIVKPTMQYPIEPLFKLGPKIILTSSFEGPTGIAQIERLATRHQLNETYHGLDTLRYFENTNDPLSNRPLETATS